jgi:membrane protein implicated in regulation of membrane protease activity
MVGVGMDDWVFWLIAAVILGAGETATMGFFLAPFAIGALVATVLSLAGAGVAVCLVAALVVSVAALVALRPLARSHRRLPPQLRTGTARLIGREALVLERTDRDGGAIKLEGEHWTARAFEESRVFEPGERVQVIEIRGATALVTE